MRALSSWLLLLFSLSGAFVQRRHKHDCQALLARARKAPVEEQNIPAAATTSKPNSVRSEESGKAAPRKRKPKDAPSEDRETPAKRSRTKTQPALAETRRSVESSDAEMAVPSSQVSSAVSVPPEPVLVALTPEELEERKEQLLEAARRKAAKDKEGAERARALADYILQQVPEENRAVSRLRQNKNALLSSLRWSTGEDLEVLSQHPRK